MTSSGTERSERWRERRRRGLMVVTISVSPAHRRAFECMGLIEAGQDRDKDAVAWAVERYLDTAPAVQAIGDALYPDDDDDNGGDEGADSNGAASEQRAEEGKCVTESHTDGRCSE